MFRSAFGGAVILFASTCQVVEKFFAGYGESPNQGNDVHNSSCWQMIPEMKTTMVNSNHPEMICGAVIIIAVLVHLML